jgi:hypothetical protein
MPTKKATTSAKAGKKNTAAKKANPKTSATAPAKAKMSALDAAARVLAVAGGAMSTAELIEAMAAKKLWQSPNGKTPAATLYAALLREISTKGADSRFKKTEPGRFAATDKAKPPTTGESKSAPKWKTKGGKKKGAGTASEVAIPNEATLPTGTPELTGI